MAGARQCPLCPWSSCLGTKGQRVPAGDPRPRAVGAPREAGTRASALHGRLSVSIGVGPLGVFHFLAW